MNKTIVKYGLISGALMVALMVLGGLYTGYGPESFQISEIIGYSTMILSLLLIFLAVNEYRKQQADKSIRFLTACWIGLAISSIAGVMFGIYNWVFVTYIAPEFMDQYFNYYVEGIRNSGLPADQAEKQIQALQQQKTLFMNPMVNFLVMFFTVVIIGTLVSLFSAAIQSRMRGG